ncbi:hypothetical protein HLB30_03160 [Peptostreptococcus russellii]|uniref:DUF308 domain-containing protein n=1 Tax=Peptostreptococcus russellii TaxID=215200 RepID=UPI0016243D64|nr:DUF308 domain-containing protein [Peptostreptococcus russellii]MBC2577518.1 hypothetical protein [Peptostreptococcus russellii]
MFFNFNLNDLYRKENSKKLIILGVILLAIGANCISRKTMGLRVFSWGIAIAFLYGAWICLKEVNQLRSYASKKEINRFRITGIILLVVAILLAVFPVQVNIVLSMAAGIYILIYEFLSYRRNRRYAYYSVGPWKVTKIVIGILLLVSPLFLTRFLVVILSMISIIFGINFLTAGLGMRSNNERF